MVSDIDIFVHVKYDGDFAIFKEMIKNSDVNIRNKRGCTLLHIAISRKRDVIAFDLLKMGIDVNVQDYKGQTVLHYLGFYMKHWNIELAKKIINQGGNLEIKDEHGNTPLWYAVHFSKGNYEFVQLLVEHGANPSSQNNVEKTPLDIALRIGDQKLLAIIGK
jgi:ankyrin repeat protein